MPGMTDGRLEPCPSSPNCVSTQSTDQKHAMPAIAYDTTPEEAKARLVRVLRSMKRITFVTDTPNYLHVQFRSRVFRFVDDVEFYIDPDAKIIHFRAAAQKGYFDFGVNRRRMRTIAQVFASATI
jgi:uncharacterized protein (DUF1499 family)